MFTKVVSQDRYCWVSTATSSRKHGRYNINHQNNRKQTTNSHKVSKYILLLPVKNAGAKSQH